jgi:ABC-type Zn uptake system ZnuABC Zn-binding protein ZnuA
MNLKEIKKELLKLSKQSKETYNESITEVLSGYNNKDWKKYISFDKNKYKRNYIYKSDDLEIILICW